MNQEQKKTAKPELRVPTQVGLGVERITKKFKMPKVERRIVGEVRSLGFFSGFRKLKHHNQLLFGIIISAAIIIYWRGLWALYDLFWDYLLPEHRVTAALASVLIGLFILVGSDYAVKAVLPR